MSSVRHWSGLALGATLAVVGCAEPVKDINRVQPNALRKDLFKGTWYFARTVVDAPYETEGTFVGDRQESLFKEDFPAYKVRWRIEEDRLMACRVDEIVVGSNSTGAKVSDYEDTTGTASHPATVSTANQNGELDPLNGDVGADVKFPCHHPVAEFQIQGHFDIKREYNSATGEQSNVIDENQSDRPWYQRDYFRIDWTDIGVTELGLNVGSDSIPEWGLFQPGIDNVYYVQAEDGDCRESKDDGTLSYKNCEEGFLPPVVEDQSILITNRMTLSPPEGGTIGCLVSSNCALNEIGMRYSFMKLPDVPVEQQYVPLPYPDDHFERFGFWRVNKATYMPGRAETDFRDYLAARWNIFQNWRDKNGKPLAQPNGVKKIDYYLNREFPTDLKVTAFKMAKEWSDAYNGVYPGVDIEKECKAVCGTNTPIDQCNADSKDFHMDGPCVFNLHENSGEEFLGDLRYSMIAFIEDPSYGQPCGVGGPANDPETGEMINGVAYVYGAGCFDYLETRVLDMVDLLCAQHKSANDPLPAACDGISEEAFTKGLRVAKIAQAQGHVLPVSVPVIGRTAMTGEASAAMQRNLHSIAANFEELRQHPEAMHASQQRLKGTPFERALIPDALAAAYTNGVVKSSAELTQEQVDAINPLDPMHSNDAKQSELDNLRAAHAVESAEYLFNDSGIWALASRNMDLTREQFRQFVRQEAFRSVTLHELGHNMGLRHNFISSFDRDNYFPEYWQIKKDARKAFAETYGHEFSDLNVFQGSNESAADFAVRVAQWNTDRENIRQMERDAGIKENQYSSIMDYAALYYTDWHGLGSYDKAAMRFIHAGLVDRSKCEGSDPFKCDLSDTNREHVKWYAGGQFCGSDADCPSNADGQKCRYNSNAATKVCSAWDDDEADSSRFILRHKFCSDDRVNDQPFCNRFDEGDSSEEIIRNMIEQYENMFVFRNFREYRSGFSEGAYFDRIRGMFIQIGDQMQSLLYKLIYEVNFQSIDGPGGFDDMFRATVVGFDFLGNVLSRPESGAYQLYKPDGVFEKSGGTALIEQENDENLNVPLGMGKPLYSSYERGYFGEVERLAYIGTFYDKLAALLVLTSRDFGTQSYNNEERFSLNFYDFFPDAYVKLLAPYMTGNTGAAGLVYDRDTKTLYPRRFWDGSNAIYGRKAAFDPAAGQPDGVRLEPGASTYLGLYALIFAAQNTPVYFDLSFKNSMRIFELGGNTGFDVGSQGGVGGVDPADLVTYTSPITHRTFVAVKTETVSSLAEGAIGRANEIATRYTTLQAKIEACNANAAECNFDGGLTKDTAIQELEDRERRLSTQEDGLANTVGLLYYLGIGSL